MTNLLTAPMEPLTPSKQSLAYSNIYKSFHRYLQERYPGFYPYSKLVEKGHEIRPQYAYSLLQAALLAKRLGYRQISALEFGCAGGAGLIDLEYLGAKIYKATGVSVKIYGFDSGIGLLPSKDYRDCLYLWQPGDYEMAFEKLSKRIRSAEIILGDVSETVREFTQKYNPPPIGFISCDLDYFTSTFSAIAPFTSIGNEFLLPRVFVYFDDTLYTSRFTGELLAIEKFNELSDQRKIDQIPLCAEFLGQRWGKWYYLAKKFYWLHCFDHPLYSVRDIKNDHREQLPL